MAVDPGGLEQTVRSLADSKEAVATEPSVQFNPDPNLPKDQWFDYTDPSFGIETDADKLWQDVRAAFENQTFGEISIPYNEIPAEGSGVDLRDITSQVVSFSTHMTNDTNRIFNIKLACSKINGTVVYPGGEFSMNDTTGERTVKTGYKEANVIMGGNELIPGIAGGVCQVSGTLYNALLRADLEVTERHHHSFELTYLTRGRDSTVDYGTMDLKFTNNTGYSCVYRYVRGRAGRVRCGIRKAPSRREIYRHLCENERSDRPRRRLFCGRPGGAEGLRAGRCEGTDGYPLHGL